MWIVAAVAVGLITVGVIAFRMMGSRFPWFQFYLKGKESGFSLHEVNLLRKVAVENRLRNPTSLFWSVKQLDNSIRGMILRMRSHGREEDEGSIQFISKLFDFRKRVEFRLPRYRLGLKSTRQIIPNQKIKITFPGGGVYQSFVIENMKKYIAISYPDGPVLPPGFLWKDRVISVYFWRAEDAGYFFESRVIGDFIRQNYSVLHLTHVPRLVRAQKRRSRRTDLNGPGTVFILKSLGQGDEVWMDKPGLRCRILNISENGLAVLVGGHGKPGVFVKVQFVLLDRRVVMCGTVKGVTYDNKKSQSILHVEAVNPSPGMKNTILAHVYGLFADEVIRHKPQPSLPVRT